MAMSRFAEQSIALAESILYSYFIEHDNEAVLDKFSRKHGNWIGWGKTELYTNYEEVFNTFGARNGAILDTKLDNMQTKILFENDNICILFLGCNITTFAQNNIDITVYARYSFIIGKEDKGLKVIHVHSSVAWEGLNDKEYYPHSHYHKILSKYEKSFDNSSILTDVAIEAPNGLKCCSLDKNFSAFFINKFFYKLVGYDTMADMIEQTGGLLSNMVYTSDLKRVDSIMKKHRDINKPYAINYRLMRKNKPPIWVIEYGKYIKYGDKEYFICSLMPIEADNSEREIYYGDLITDNSQMDNPELPIDLYLKTLLDISSDNDTKENKIRRILELCCSVLQVTGMFIQDAKVPNSNIPILYKYSMIKPDIIKDRLPYSVDDILDFYNKEGFYYCSDTSILPIKYQNQLKCLNIKSYISKYVKVNGKIAYIFTIYRCYNEHKWTANEIDLIEQTIKFLLILL